MPTVRKTGGRNELDAYANSIRGLMYRLLNSCEATADIGDGTTNGNLRTTAAVVPKIDGVPNASLASTDDFWDLSGETAVSAGKFRGYWLYVDSANAASFVAGSEADSLEDSARFLPDLDDSKSIIGVYAAGPATDFTLALAAQGTILDRVPNGVAGVVIDTDITLVAP